MTHFQRSYQLKICKSLTKIERSLGIFQKLLKNYEKFMKRSAVFMTYFRSSCQVVHLYKTLPYGNFIKKGALSKILRNYYPSPNFQRVFPKNRKDFRFYDVFLKFISTCTPSLTPSGNFLKKITALHYFKKFVRKYFLNFQKWNICHIFPFVLRYSYITFIWFCWY